MSAILPSCENHAPFAHWQVNSMHMYSFHNGRLGGVILYVIVHIIGKAQSLLSKEDVMSIPYTLCLVNWLAIARLRSLQAPLTEQLVNTAKTNTRKLSKNKLQLQYFVSVLSFFKDIFIRSS